MKRLSENTEKIQEHLFKPGKSGNPAGRPRGARNKATLAALELLEGEAEALTRKAIDAALGGDMTALKMCLERLVPVAKERPVAVTFPTVTSADELPQFTGALLEAVGNGAIDPAQAAAVAKIIDIHRNSLELAEIEKRLQRLEESSNEKGNLRKN